MKPRTIRPRWRVWQAVAMMLEATMTAMYGGMIHTFLNDPAGRQKIDPMAMEAPAMMGWL